MHCFCFAPQNYNQFWWGIIWSCLQPWFSWLSCTVQSYWRSCWACKTLFYHWELATYTRTAGDMNFLYFLSLVLQIVFPFSFLMLICYIFSPTLFCVAGGRLWCSNFRLWYDFRTTTFLISDLSDNCGTYELNCTSPEKLMYEKKEIRKAVSWFGSMLHGLFNV